MKKRTFIKKSARVNEDHYKRPNDECQMAKIQLKSIIENATDILENISKGDQLDAWVQTLIATAQDDISAVRNYIVLGKDPEEDMENELIGGPKASDDHLAYSEDDMMPDDEMEVVAEIPPMEIEPEEDMEDIDDEMPHEEIEVEEIENKYPEETMEEYGMYESIKMPRLKSKI